MKGRLRTFFQHQKNTTVCSPLPHQTLVSSCLFPSWHFPQSIWIPIYPFLFSTDCSTFCLRQEHTLHESRHYSCLVFHCIPTDFYNGQDTGCVSHKIISRDFPGGQVVRTLYPLPKAQVQPLAGELRSYKLNFVAQKIFSFSK